uniref:Uncharacterized protein n=1 Tax=Setaria italica TaxID=4555 RepID=K3YLB7_SETIT
MAVASAVVPSCPPPSLHGRSRLSRASGVAVPPPPPRLFAGDDARTTPLTNVELRALMRRQCELVPFSDDDDDLPPPLLLSRENNLQLQAQLLCSQFQSPPLSLDNLNAPVSEDDVDVLAPMFSEEEIQVLWPAGTGSDERQAGEKRRSPPWPSCISDDDDNDEPPPPPVKRARTRTKTRSRRRDGARATRLRLRLREWHNAIARLILRHQFRGPELSRGRTALGCQCHEIALAGVGGCCALHQDGPQPDDRAWMYSAQGRVPLVGGPGEVLVPTLSAGNSKATVVQYARWRRGVRMPTRFYVENAVQQQRGMAAADQQPNDDWMVTD